MTTWGDRWWAGLTEEERREHKRISREGNAERDLEVAALRARGLTLQQIGDRYGVSRQTIYQILKRTGGPG